ncbi:hypothetical protein A3B05_02975 [Candidatus Giovannonibacteria bacterium RIFCSPLOWO2_01_FULL_43_160]|uniref:DUF5666 domain-containing protein n=2 Tax=Candidatus Giovannoniibacteriota TaxID=1752738 RepID=A0A1F5XVI4_9BACT|nr:MAG: hypothetical protein A2652_02780 [Candidatus Giovannonibacteria bacterium RIFCSPHIGHO2_01_FULL_43_140]OGF70382.1 MAG: hypothetical protein A3C76_01285 [Candidatus Giovannonibacteria bacterium RIFCSPHIGHO2_02_FULL_44_51]OGF71376.1 MAG: hypothetical protein A3E35_03085 [Candidatus Giovannonibacteria bacterium RIFCSPHIGHO2_12_FULL_44_22]OGF74901.1 MAG: hypothetical protein A3B05_02975 [Candidatus Giovannonibacteria bacterium RIFCSPLOWO2_01_FULL_43_160]OGF86323.1 MAG: hypothetical protein A
MNKSIVIMIAVTLIVGVGAFYGGMKYAENKATASRQQRAQQFSGNAGVGFSGGTGGGQRGGGARLPDGQGFISGEIISKDDKSVTVKLQDGGSKIVFLSDSMKITKSTDGALSDLEVGQTVSINGTANSDGSITAQTMQLRQQP